MTDINIATYGGLVLSILFWILSWRQANKAKKILDEIKSAILTWQAELNKASIDLISSRPEIIAKQVSLEEAKAHSEFSKQLSKIIQDLSSKPLPIEQGGAYQLKMAEQLQTLYNTLIIEREKIMAQVASNQRPQNP